MKVEVWKCDGCGKILEKKSQVYRIKIESLPFKTMGDPEGRDEIIPLNLDFCYACARDLYKTLKKLSKKRIEADFSGRITIKCKCGAEVYLDYNSDDFREEGDVLKRCPNCGKKYIIGIDVGEG